MHNMRVCAFYGHFHANRPQKTIKDSCYTMSERERERVDWSASQFWNMLPDHKLLHMWTHTCRYINVPGHRMGCSGLSWQMCLLLWNKCCTHVIRVGGYCVSSLAIIDALYQLNFMYYPPLLTLLDS